MRQSPVLQPSLACSYLLRNHISQQRHHRRHPGDDALERVELSIRVELKNRRPSPGDRSDSFSAELHQLQSFGIALRSLPSCPPLLYKWDMSEQHTTEHRLRSSLESLAVAVDEPFPQVADWGVMPRALVLAAADVYETELSKGTAEQQLLELIDRAGLVDDSGAALTFKTGRSAELSSDLARRVQAIRSKNQRLVRLKKPARLRNDWIASGRRASKLEIVNKISALTHSGPETLGPGSKERKSVLTNLYQGLHFGVPPQMPKTELGSLLAQKLSVEWDYGCYSTGETLTTRGLTRLLDGAITYLQRRDLLPETSIQDEASMYSGVILQSILGSATVDSVNGEASWDGYAAVEEMVSKEYAHARQTEWPGWYFEYRSLPALRRRFEGGPHPVGSTTFDYRGIRTWDLKSHSERPGSRRTNQVPLNDRASIREAVTQDGLGFIILRGAPLYEDEESFYEWHNTVVRGKQKAVRPARSRRLKTGFSMTALDFFFIDNANRLEELESAGVISDFAQGQQAGGETRKLKYKLDIRRAANTAIRIYHVDIPEYVANIVE